MKIVDVPEEGRRFVTWFTTAQKTENCSTRKAETEANTNAVKQDKERKTKGKHISTQEV